MSGKVDFKTMIKLGIVLTLFATSACVILALVDSITKPQIEKNQADYLEAAIKDLFPDADNFKEINDVHSPDPAVSIENAFVALKHNEINGMALILSRASYSGSIRIMTGVNSNGIINGVKILSHSDTPGLGANAASSTYFVDRANGITFYGQFAGKKTSDPFEVKKDVIIITASTITSRAVAESVKAAGHAAVAWFTKEEQ
jgi:electron transport complex protein RnfG